MSDTPTAPDPTVEALQRQVADLTGMIQNGDSAKDKYIADLENQINALRGRRNLPASEAPFISHTVTVADVSSTKTDAAGGVVGVHPLEAIGAKYNVDPNVIYARNATRIEAEAGARGFPDSEGGRLLWPGTELKVPKVA